MKSNRIILSVLVIFSVIFFFSCVKKPSYPSTPLISFNNVFRYGNNPDDPDSIKVAINFEDEEGDIGLDQSDNSGVFKTGNLWLVYYYDSANAPSPYQFCAVDTSAAPLTPFDTLKIGFRVPVVLTSSETSQPMKGIIYAKLDRGSIQVHPTDKTIKYKIYLYDRAMHKSNTVDSGPIIF